MGDPRRRRKKYAKPMHPWQKERIDAERIFLKEYGLKNKKEIWKMDSLLRKFKRQAKRLIKLPKEKAKSEIDGLLKKLATLGLVGKNPGIEDVLSIELKDLLERRLQTILHRKKLAASAIQARQFITHMHVSVGERVVSSPSYLVSIDEESKISFRSGSALFSEDHPERKATKEDDKKHNKEKETVTNGKGEN